MKTDGLTLSRVELLALGSEIVIGVALVAAVAVRVVREQLAPVYAYAVGFFVAWLLLYPLMRVAARRKGNDEPAPQYVLRGLLASVAGIGAGTLYQFLR